MFCFCFVLILLTLDGMWYRIPVYGMSLWRKRPPSKSQYSSYELFTQLYTFRGATQSRRLAKKNSEKTKLVRSYKPQIMQAMT